MKYKQYFFVFFIVIFVFTPSFSIGATTKLSVYDSAIEQKIKKNDDYVGSVFLTKTKSYILLNIDDLTPLIGKNILEQRPIASLTKLMTAMVALDKGFNFEGTTKYNPSRHYAYRNYMNSKKGEVFSNSDLWYSMLTGSMNIPARMIVDSLGMTDEEFVAEMNYKAQILGFSSTNFDDVSGLSKKNVSNSYEVGLMFNYALRYPEIRKALSINHYEFDEIVSIDKRVHHSFDHTDILRKKEMPFDIIASKTGYTYEAGPCIASFITYDNSQYIVVTLGEGSYVNRHKEVAKFMNWWAENNFLSLR